MALRCFGMAALVVASTAFLSADEVREVLSEERIQTPKVLEFEMEVPTFSIEHQVRLSLEARIDWPDLSGSNPWLIVWVNDNPLTADHLLNKRNEFTTAQGMDLQWYHSGFRWRVLYSPDFRAALEQTGERFAMAKEDDPYRFVWDITALVKPGRNHLKVSCLQVLAEAPVMVLRQIQVEVGKAIEAPRLAPVAPAPAGPVPTYVARPPSAVPMAVAVSPQGHMVLEACGRSWAVTSRASLPGGGWQEAAAAAAPVRLGRGETAQVSWSAGPFRIERAVVVETEHVAIRDRVVNTGEALAGLILHHRAVTTAAPERVHLGGVPNLAGQGRLREPSNPSVVARYGGVGLGVLAEDDVLRVQALCCADDDGIGLTDDRLALEAGGAVTLEWSLYPLPDGDYWSFVNAVRRVWDSAVTIPGPFIFRSNFPSGAPAADHAAWMRARDLKYVCGGIAKFPNGRYAHGTGILSAPAWVAEQRDWTRKLREAAPETVPIQYFHAQITTEPGGETTYAECRLLDERGRPMAYPYSYPLPLYVPTRDNAYGKALWGYVNTLIDEIGVAGVYWDELAASAALFHYGEPWDGVTGLIDPRTHAVVRRISCVSLLMQPLQQDIIRHIRGKGLFLMANGQAKTRTIHREKLVFFSEANTYSALSRGHLGSPVGLGNHHPEDSVAASVRHIRDMLHYGTVYHGHTYHHDPAPWNVTAVMYPITPVELGPGYVLGAERIHTAVSGRFGWPDGAAADVYVVNAAGERVEPAPVEAVVEGGRQRYEIRMPGDHIAILVRHDARPGGAAK
ncbi:MAG: hypothetical protein GX595_09960 [Lentisphaerae bacterium]|nr:hypothetical protein [Lentisphaerota bacterium]